MNTEYVAYRITATHEGQTVQAITCISKERDYSLSWDERKSELMEVIAPVARERFGEGVVAEVSWEKSHYAELHL